MTGGEFLVQAAVLCQPVSTVAGRQFFPAAEAPTMQRIDCRKRTVINVWAPVDHGVHLARRIGAGGHIFQGYDRELKGDRILGMGRAVVSPRGHEGCFQWAVFYLK